MNGTGSGRDRTPTSPGQREAAYLRLIRGESSGALASSARIGLAAASFGYAAAIAARNLGFDRGWLNSTHASIPVVSVGNLTLGGTGKTPMVEWVGRWYRARGVRAAVLSRGYSRDAGAGVNDEAMVLEENLPDVPHLQDPDRVKIAGIAVAELDSQVLILDDGFQHRRLARDLDLVLIDALNPFGPGGLVPRGLLREPIGALRRADIMVVSRADLVSRQDREAIRQRAERASGPLLWVTARHAPVDLIGERVADEPVPSLNGRTVAAFCGIGNPDGFQKTIAPHCQKVVDFRVFPDHHAYNGSDVADLTRWARACGVDLVLTTQKDLVKLRVENLGGVPLRAVRIGLEVLEGGDILDAALERLLPDESAFCR